MSNKHFDAYMVKIMCSNVKMEFDMAKANFLEIHQDMQVFCKYVSTMEKMGKANSSSLAFHGQLLQAKEAMQRFKVSMGVLKGKLTKNSQRAEQGYLLLNERFLKIEERIDVIMKKKRQYEEMQSQYNKLRTRMPRLEGQAGVGGLQDICYERRLKKLRLEDAIQKAETVICNAEKEKEVLQEACSKVQVFLDNTKEVFDHLRSPRCSRRQGSSNLLSWINDAMKTKEDMDMVHLHLVNDTTLAFEFITPLTVPTNVPRLVLTVNFLKNSGSSYLYSPIDIKANIDSLYINDVAEEAIERKSLLDSLLKVHTRWIKHIPLLQEIIQLRDKYPVDWLVELNRLRVILGSSGYVVCTLTIPKGYPDEGAVALEKMDGLTVPVNIAKYKPPNDNSLTGWLEYLDHELNGPD